MATKSNVVSWMGVAMGVVQGLLKEVQKLGGGDEDVRRLVTPEGEGLLAKFAEMIIGVIRPTYKVVVDYTKTLTEMISVGKYDWTNNDIIANNFPVKGEGKQERELVLFHFNRVISSDEAMKKMEEAGYKPTVIEELLAFGESQPELQRQFPIVSLGSVWRDSSGARGVPCLLGCGAGRSLDLDDFGGGWDECSRFLARRK